MLACPIGNFANGGIGLGCVSGAWIELNDRELFGIHLVGANVLLRHEDVYWTLE
jgi:hypothetical protein